MRTGDGRVGGLDRRPVPRERAGRGVCLPPGFSQLAGPCGRQAGEPRARAHQAGNALPTWLVPAFLGLALLLGGRPRLGAASYVFTPLDVPGAGYTVARGINNLGTVVGACQLGGADHGYLLNPGGSFLVIDVPPGDNGTAVLGINHAGQVVGNYFSTPMGSSGFVRDAAGGFTRIDCPGALLGTVAFGINDAGVLVGAYGAPGGYRGFLREAGGNFSDLAFPAPAEATYAVGINNAGAVVGFYYRSGPTGGAFHGFLRTADHVWSDIDVPGGDGTRAHGINQAGRIVGSYSAGDSRHGFLRDVDGTFTTIDFPGADLGTEVYGINDAGTIVGLYSVSTGTHGFVATPAPPPDATPPVTTATAAPGPNERGWNNSRVLVTLVAVDHPGGSGVKEIEYLLQGAQTGGGTAAGSSVEVAISAEGTTTLTYLSRDNAGNEEEPRSRVVRVDTTPPAVRLSAATSGLWPPNHQGRTVRFTGTMMDGVSGLEPGGATYRVTDDYGLPMPAGQVTSGPSGSFSLNVPLPASRRGADRDGRRYRVTVSARDNAGNTGSASVSLVVPHDQRP